MREAGVTSIYVEHPRLGHLDRFVARSAPRPARWWQTTSRTCLPQLLAKRPLPSAMPTITRRGTKSSALRCKKGWTVSTSTSLSRRPDDHAGHAAAVAVLAVMLGVRLEDYLVSQRRRLNPAHAKEVVNLAVAGMLHDIGKAKLPAELRAHDEAAPRRTRTSEKSGPRTRG